MLFCRLLIFFKINFWKNSFRNTIRMSNSLDPDQARRIVGPDLGPNCLPKLSADDTGRQRVNQNATSWIRNFKSLSFFCGSKAQSVADLFKNQKTSLSDAAIFTGINIHEPVITLGLPVNCLLLILANSLDPNQAQRIFGPDQGPNCLTFWWYFWNNFFKKLILKKKLADNKKAWKITQYAMS